MTPFTTTPGGYAARWELPEIEAYANFADEVALLLRSAVTARPANQGDGPVGKVPGPDTGVADGQVAARASAANDANLAGPGSHEKIAGAGLNEDELAVLAQLDFSVEQQPVETRSSIGGKFGSEFGREFSDPAATPTAPLPANAAHEPYPNPVLDRLLPPANKWDKALAHDFRQLTVNATATAKADALTQFAQLLREGASHRGRIVVPREDGPSVAAALTDLRLVLAVQLGIQNEHDTERLEREALRWAKQAARGRQLPVASDFQFLVSLYLVAGAALESLLQCMLAEL